MKKYVNERQSMIDRTLFFLYNALWTLVGVPLLVLARRRKGTSLFERLWTEFPACRDLKGSIWVHALSVGEVISALPLVKRIREEYPRPLVFTASTSQGLDIARKELGGKVDCLFRMPLDFWWPMRRVIRFIDPSLMLVIETDLWPGYLRLLKQRGVRILLVNSRISPRTFRSYRRSRSLVRRMLFSAIDRCLAQSAMDRQRLLETGVAPDKVEESGNIKFDREWEPLRQAEKESLRISLGIGPGERVWVAGSTHPGEDEIVLETFLRLRKSFPALRLIIAPRRIEDGPAVLGLALAKGLKPALRTGLASGNIPPFDVLVIDTLGELGRIYALGSVNFVGGSLVAKGGHNLLEPASHGRPVLFGPHVEDFLTMSELLVEAGGGMRVGDGEALYRAMEGLLSDSSKAEQIGGKAGEFVERNRGALNRVLEEVRISLSPQA